jgi:hypothetical protein
MQQQKPGFEKIEEIKHKADLITDDLISIAITFAEAGELEIAIEVMKEAEKSVKNIKRLYQKIFEHKVHAPKMSRANA